MHYIIRAATKFDAKNMAFRLRQEDAREIRSATGKAPYEILPDCVVPEKTFVLHVSFSKDYPGSLLALFGVCPFPDKERVGIPWMVATPLLVRHQIYILRNSKKWIDTLAADYDLLINCVDARNEVHIKWLKWCGFTFTQLHAEWGHDKLPFWQFEKTTNV